MEQISGTGGAMIQVEHLTKYYGNFMEDYGVAAQDGIVPYSAKPGGSAYGSRECDCVEVTATTLSHDYLV